MDAILIEKLTKTYKPAWPWQKPTTVLSDISLAVGKGQIFGFLGPNGAGKTTTMKALLGLIRPTSGRVEILGAAAKDVSVHSRIGYLPESPYFYDYLTADEFLRFYGRLGAVPHEELAKRIPPLLAQVGLSQARHCQLRKFSKGMLQRIGLAQALIHDPELVILDEPMSGLDPVGRKDVRDLMLSLRDQGKTVFFSTHIISDVEMICDQVCIVAKGRVVTQGRIEELVQQGSAQSVEVVCEGVIGEEIPEVKQAATRILQRGFCCLMELSNQNQLDAILVALRQSGGKVVSVTRHKGSLEDVFIERTTRS